MLYLRGMKNKSTALFITCLLLFGSSALQAQLAILSSGGNISGSNGSVSYSVGQIAFLTNTGTTGIITEGVQQPFEILIIEGITEKGINLECSAYPNPATGFVMLKIDRSEIRGLSYQLYTLTGVLLQNNNIGDNEIPVPLDGLLPATYILNVSVNDISLKTFKIIKK